MPVEIAYVFLHFLRADAANESGGAEGLEAYSDYFAKANQELFESLKPLV